MTIKEALLAHLNENNGKWYAVITDDEALLKEIQIHLTESYDLGKSSTRIVLVNSTGAHRMNYPLSGVYIGFKGPMQLPTMSEGAFVKTLTEGLVDD